MTDDAAPPAWALVQTKPRVAVLAVSRDRARIKEEGLIMASVVNETVDSAHHQFRIIQLEPVRV